MIDDRRLYQLVGERLRKLRDESAFGNRRMTQADLASVVGLERTSITNIEKGTQKASLHVLYALCEALHTDLIDLLPARSEVVREDALPPENTSVEFGGKTYFAPPKALKKITAILDLDDSNAASYP
jgi:DNA-binding XRE family transcriptional regulator